MNAKFLLVLVVVSLAACENRVGSEQAAPVEQFSQQVAESMTDLSNRLGIQPDQINLVSEKMVTWRNGSLGCPREGMMYTQALVEGTLIVLRVDGKAYQYHSGKGRPPFYCEHPEQPETKPGAN